MSMSAQSPHPAAVTMTADPRATGPQFAVVSRGYHQKQVDEWVSEARAAVKRLEAEAASFIGREARSPEGRKLMVDVLQVIADEATGQQQAAQAEIEQMIAGARDQSAQIIAEARQQAADSNASASQQANALISSARADSKRTRDEAEAYAAAVHEAAGARLAQIIKIHRDTLDRVNQVNRVTGETLVAEQQRGSIEDEVARALAPISVRLLALDVRPRAAHPPPVAGVVHPAVVACRREPPVHGLPRDVDALVLQHGHDLADVRPYPAA
jgi:hypothetical protein